MKTTVTKKVNAVKPVCGDLSEQHDKAMSPEQVCIGLLAVDDTLEAYGQPDNHYHEPLRKIVESAMQIVNEHAALVGALDKINAITKAGVIHRSETGKPQWSAFDEIRNIVAAVRGGKAGS
jgi:hypothetical protein